MRSSSVATALAAFTAGVTVSAALRRVAARRVPAPAATASTASTAGSPDAGTVPDRDAVVLPFTRPAPAPAPVAAQPAAPARCGDSGGRTKAGAPCAARPSAGGRCHHHPLAA
jgi:hypothetical protein